MLHDDADLLARIRNGAADDFAEIVGRHQSQVFAILYRYERDFQKLEDLAQETFLKAWRALASFDGRAPFQHWLSRIATRVALDHLRKERRHRNEIGLEDLGEDALEWLRHPDEHNDLEAAQAAELLGLAMRELSPAEQIVLTMQELEVRESGNGKWHLMRVRPYKTWDNKIEGAVLSFQDIDALKRNLEQAQLYADAISETARHPILVLDSNLRVRKVEKRIIDERVRAAAVALNLTDYLARKPAQLSGGQRQRVAMGRAIVRDPQVFLFDEPLSNLDAKLRVAMRTEIKELHQRLKTTTVYVTHDQIEAMTLADRIVVMHDGVVEQIGAPLELYDRPQNLFVAGFIGSPAMNFLNGTIRANGALAFEGAHGVRLPLAAAPAGSDGRPVIYGIRPEHFVIADDGAEAEVQVVEPTGSELQIAAKLGGDDIIAVFRERHDFKPGDKIRLKPDPRLAHLFDEPSGKRLNA
jgi:multiple sugar transport system ATP-binding protein